MLTSGDGALIVTGLIVTSTTNALGQGNDRQNMPGMTRPKAKSKASRKARPKKKRVARKRRPAKTGDMSNMPGMKRSGMQRRKAASRRKKTPAQNNSTNKKQMGNMPGMNMPAKPSSSPTQSPAPQPSPQKCKMNRPRYADATSVTFALAANENEYARHADATGFAKSASFASAEDGHHYADARSESVAEPRRVE